MHRFRRRSTGAVARILDQCRPATRSCPGNPPFPQPRGGRRRKVPCAAMQSRFRPRVRRPLRRVPRMQLLRRKRRAASGLRALRPTPAKGVVGTRHLKRPQTRGRGASACSCRSIQRRGQTRRQAGSNGRRGTQGARRALRRAWHPRDPRALPCQRCRSDRGDLELKLILLRHRICCRLPDRQVVQEQARPSASSIHPRKRRRHGARVFNAAYTCRGAKA